jgi:hypothetical protein
MNQRGRRDREKWFPPRGLLFGGVLYGIAGLFDVLPEAPDCVAALQVQGKRQEREQDHDDGKASHKQPLCFFKSLPGTDTRRAGLLDIDDQAPAVAPSSGVETGEKRKGAQRQEYIEKNLRHRRVRCRNSGKAENGRPEGQGGKNDCPFVHVLPPAVKGIPLKLSLWKIKKSKNYAIRWHALCCSRDQSRKNYEQESEKE